VFTAFLGCFVCCVAPVALCCMACFGVAAAAMHERQAAEEGQQSIAAPWQAPRAADEMSERTVSGEAARLRASIPARQSQHDDHV
jgi:hypothetical protein